MGSPIAEQAFRGAKKETNRLSEVLHGKTNNYMYGDLGITSSALELQVGGSHYKEMVIQPIEYILANKLGWCEGNIVKYITRHHQKGGKADIEKVIHYAQLLLETKYK